jgi:thiamine-monophosphate kinase
MAYHRPRPQVHAGGLVGLYGVPSAMIDTSDGVLQDLGHILKASRVGAQVESYQLTIPPELVALEEAGAGRALDWVLTGGEDFCLILTVPPARMPKLWDMARQRDWIVQDLGEIRAPEEGLQVLGLDGQPLEMEKLGFRHFEDS